MNKFAAAFNTLRAAGNQASKAGRCGKRRANRLPFTQKLRLESLEERALLSVCSYPLPPTSSQPTSGAAAAVQAGVQKPVVVGPIAPTTPAASAVAANPATHLSAYATIPVQQGSNNASSLAGALPSSFDLRNDNGHNYVTSVKNQGSWGTCWTFSCYASLESSILMTGGATTDFSERNMAYMHGFDWGPDDGGDAEISEAYLSRLSGPINESDDPYSKMGQADSVTGPVQDYVRDMLRLSSPTEIKTALTTYGAVETFIYFDPYTASYYNQSNYTYCYQGSNSTDHGVTIVGWDDSKVTSGGTGAWLIKNSWGTTTNSWGGVANDNGYFWLSYQDTYGGKTGELFYDAVPASTYSKEYYWDNFGDITELNTPYAFNAYTASANSSLKSVGFYTEADGASYNVRVYGTYSGGTLSNLLASTSGSETYAGYHTIDLPSSVALTAGSNFYVYVGITGGGSYMMATDYAASGYDSASTASPGQSYYSFDGNSWTDVTTWNATANFCIKALVQTGGVSATPATPDLVSASDTGISNTDNITNLDNSTSAKTLQFSVGGTVAGATVTVYAGGTAIGSAIASGTSTTVTTNGSYDLLDGSQSITACQTESGKTQSVASTALTVTIDTVAPAAPIAPDLEAGSDSGISNTDNITNDNTPTFDVSAASGVYWRIYRNGTLVSQSPATGADGGIYKGPASGSETLLTQADGTYSYTVRAVDAAGNESADSTALSVTIVATRPWVASSTPSTLGPTNLSSLTFAVVFCEPVSNVTADDFLLTTSGTAAGTIASVNASSGTSFNVTVNAITGEGTLRLDLKDGTDVEDAAGNFATASTSGNTVTLSHTQTWDGGGGADHNWMTAANWANDVVPVAGDKLVFSATTPTSIYNNFAPGTTFDSITFPRTRGNGSFTLSGNSVKLAPAGGIAVTNVAGQNEIDLSIASNSTGTVVVQAGTLRLGLAAQGPALSGSGVDLQSGKLILDYTGGATPAATVRSLLTASYHGGAWDAGNFRSTTAVANGTTLGWKDYTGSSQVTVMATIPGDFNLDGTADNTDRSIWFANAWTGTTWAQGDANYDGVVDGRDRDLCMANLSRSVSTSGTSSSDDVSQVDASGASAAAGASSAANLQMDGQTSSATASGTKSTAQPGPVNASGASTTSAAILTAHDAVFNELATTPGGTVGGVFGAGLAVVESDLVHPGVSAAS